MKPQSITIAPQTILFTIFALIMTGIIFRIREVILAIFLAVIITSALNPAVTWLQKRKIPRPLGILLMYVIILSSLGGLLTFVIPPLSQELANLVGTLAIPQLPAEFWDFKLDLQALSSLVTQFGSSLSSIISIITTTFSGVLFLITLLVMAFYLLIDRQTLPDQITFFTENKKVKSIAQEFLDRMEFELGGWVRGQLTLMLAIGVATYAGLTLLGIPFALPLAVLAGLLEILPNIGPTLSAIPAVIIALFMVSPTMALVVVLLYSLVQVLENNILVPNIMKAAANVDPLTSIITILIGLKLGGVIGALLGIPVFIVLRIAFSIWKRER